MKHNNQGFTLIELLVVVLIIGILAAVAVPQYQKAVEKSQLAQAITMVRTLVHAETTYYMANETYTNKFDELDMSMSSNKDFSLSIHDLNTSRMHIHAYHNKTGWWLVYYMSRDKYDCVAATSNAKANKFCQSVGGVKENCPEGGYNCYTLR